MPPHADLKLEERILNAAQRLWRTRGERGLTLRAVARAAGSTTPTVYKRFRNKQALVAALGLRIRAQLIEYLIATASLEDVGRRYVEFAEQHPHEYQLLLHSWGDVFNPGVPRPGRIWLMTEFARRFGGNPEDYARAVYAIILLSHAAASMLSMPADEVSRADLRRNFLAIVGDVIEHHQVFGSPQLASKD